ncbi:cytochrome C oxidase Cbb3 [Leptobacterium flavescens]|uniref:Cytochrome C oxidase Cbb3 n=1 Tax=Leptobacterium flavescens TaxID=472055 RepID=A0A6P0UNV0_9FLAO|nr:FixH family protein [Leptobacterium flavescens]NER14845.1 cytochrome C oxidase Cbb3 [Leptobacterium flavescens]
MKINWGTGIVLVFAAFIGFIMYFVITMSTNKQYNHDLVSEEYYKKELGFQKEIDAEQNAVHLEENISGEKTAEGWLLKFPASLDPGKIEGKVFLYRPSDKRLDFNLPIVISDTYLLIPDKRLLGGRWNITVDWQYEGKSYLFKDQITY